jgi:hypothetical protein
MHKKRTELIARTLTVLGAEIRRSVARVAIEDGKHGQRAAAHARIISATNSV